MNITMDLCPYEVVEEDGDFIIKDTNIDVRVPERYTNRQGGEYCLLGTYTDGEYNHKVYMYHEETHTTYDNDEEEERFDIRMFSTGGLDACLHVLDYKMDAINEIGWEALDQAE